METEPRRRSPSLPRMPGPSTLIVAASGAAIVAILALPMIREREQPSPVAEEARAAYLTLMAQMEQPGAEGSAPAAADTSAAGLSPAGRLERDLFAPAARRLAAASGAGTSGESPEGLTAPRAPARRKPPKLTGIFIDGNQARAVIDDQVVSAGDWVRDFQVIEIRTSWVVLKRGEQVEKLELGGGR